jgi:hypothetical protein
MPRSILILATGLLLALLSGACTRTPSLGQGQKQAVGGRPVLPKADEIVSVRIVPQENLRPGTWPENPLTQPEPISEVIDWLKDIDWSAKPGDIRVMDLPPVSQLILERKTGPAVEFGLLDGGIIHDMGLWRADTDRLKAIFRRGGAS